MGMIKLPKNSLDHFHEHLDEIFSTGNLAEGKWNKKVSDWTSEYTHSKYSLAVNSNGSGLLAILIALKRYRKKSRIFLQSNTMYGVKTIASSSGLEICGYVDCQLDYLMPSIDQVKRFVDNLENPEECVFLITHIGGWTNPDIVSIAELCEDKGVSLIEDCAHSLGSLMDGKHTGLYGDAGVYSLYATKAIPVGEGGIIVFKDEELYKIIDRFIIYDRFDQLIDIGVNFRMSEVNALLSYSVLIETESIIKNKYKIANRYIEFCEQFGWEYIIPHDEEQRSNLYKFILLSRSSSNKNFEPLQTRTSPVYDYTLGEDPDNIVSNHICLPIWYGLENEIIEKVISELST